MKQTKFDRDEKERAAHFGWTGADVLELEIEDPPDPETDPPKAKDPK